MNEFCNIVVDLETLGIKAGCPVLEIGAAAQVGGNTVLTFEAHPDLQEQLEAGFVPTASTLLWWMQPDLVAARGHQLANHGKDGTSAKPVTQALWEFNAFVNTVSEGCEIRIWGNSASFDLGILGELYDRFLIPKPWEFWEERDLRTAFELLGGKPSIARDNAQYPPHTGLGDASYELSQLLYCLNQQAPTNNGFLEVAVV